MNLWLIMMDIGCVNFSLRHSVVLATLQYQREIIVDNKVLFNEQSQ